MSGAGSKRRLPIVQPPAGEDEDAPRPRWQWIVFGSALVVLAWLPLFGVTGALAARIADRADDGESALARPIATGLTIFVLHAIALGLGALAGGFVVGRWGTPGIGVREAALAALAASAGVMGLTWASGGLGWGALLVPALAVPLAALGGRAGLRKRAAAR